MKILTDIKCRSELINKISNMSYKKFEDYVAIIFKYLGYKVTVVSYHGFQKKIIGDYGADLIIIKNGIKCAVQVKHTKNNSSYLLSAINEVVSSVKYHNCDESMVVTNGPSPKRKIYLAEVNKCKIIAGDDFFKIALIYEQRKNNV
jgi:restriction system protein